MPIEIKLDRVREPPNPRSTGKAWTKETRAQLVEHFIEGYAIHEIAEILGRTQYAIALQLADMKLIIREYKDNRNRWVLKPAEKVLAIANAYLTEQGLAEWDTIHPNACCDLLTKTQPEIKEQTMNANAPTIETKTFIAGVEAKDLSDDDIFKKIAQLEQLAESLSKIQNKPKKLAAKIDGIHADIKKLVEYVDGRG